MTTDQLNSIASAYKLANEVLRQLEIEAAPASTIFALASAVGALETICLQEHRAAIVPEAMAGDLDAKGPP